MSKNTIQIDQITTGYSKKTIISDLSLEIEEGKITTIIGPNGCGKSTLLKTIGRILKHKFGDILLYDQNMKNLSTKEIAKKLAILSQSPSAPGAIKVEELISYGRYPHRKNKNTLTKQDQSMIEWAMEVTKTTEYRNEEIAQLSGGQRQRVWLAMTLAQETNILLLDEPTTYLDMAHQLEVLQIVKQLNQEKQCTVVMVLHDINHAARFSDNIIAMKDGEIIQIGNPDEIIHPSVLQQVFQIEARILKDPQTNSPVCFGYECQIKKEIYNERN